MDIQSTVVAVAPAFPSHSRHKVEVGSPTRAGARVDVAGWGGGHTGKDEAGSTALRR